MPSSQTLCDYTLTMLQSGLEPPAGACSGPRERTLMRRRAMSAASLFNTTFTSRVLADEFGYNVTSTLTSSSSSALATTFLLQRTGNGNGNGNTSNSASILNALTCGLGRVLFVADDYHHDSSDNGELFLRCGECRPGDTFLEDGACSLGEYCTDQGTCANATAVGTSTSSSSSLFGAPCPEELGGHSSVGWCGSGLRCLAGKCAECIDGVDVVPESLLCRGGRWVYHPMANAENYDFMHLVEHSDGNERSQHAMNNGSTTDWNDVLDALDAISSATASGELCRYRTFGQFVSNSKFDSTSSPILNDIPECPSSERYVLLVVFGMIFLYLCFAFVKRQCCSVTKESNEGEKDEEDPETKDDKETDRHARDQTSDTDPYAASQQQHDYYRQPQWNTTPVQQQQERQNYAMRLSSPRQFQQQRYNDVSTPRAPQQVREPQNYCRDEVTAGRSSSSVREQYHVAAATTPSLSQQQQQQPRQHAIAFPEQHQHDYHCHHHAAASPPFSPAQHQHQRLVHAQHFAALTPPMTHPQIAPLPSATQQHANLSPTTSLASAATSTASSSANHSHNRRSAYTYTMPASV